MKRKSRACSASHLSPRSSLRDDLLLHGAHEGFAPRRRGPCRDLDDEAVRAPEDDLQLARRGRVPPEQFPQQFAVREQHFGVVYGTEPPLRPAFWGTPPGFHLQFESHGNLLSVRVSGPLELYNMSAELNKGLLSSIALV